MQKLISMVLLILFICFSSFGQDSDVQKFHPHRILVKFKEESNVLNLLRQIAPRTHNKVLTKKEVSLQRTHLNKFFTDIDIFTAKALKPGNPKEKSSVGIERLFLFELNESTTVEEAIAKLKDHPEVELVEPDYIGTGGGQTEGMITPNDPYFQLQWGLKNSGQNIQGSVGKSGIDVNAVQAWDITTGNSTTLLAVLDTGIPSGSSDFSSRVVPGYDFVNNDNAPTDDHGHGTNVTSIAVATGNNGSMIAGLNWECKIMHLKTLDQNNAGFYSYWISALTMASDSGAKVINISAGGSSNSSLLKDAVDYASNKGSIIVACAMNTNNEVSYYPAAYPNVIAVGAINNKGNRAVPFCWGGGSNYGAHLDFVAPGDYVLGLIYSNTAQANYWCGTSQASPIVAGIISLMVGVKSDLTFQQVYDILKATAKDKISTSGEDTDGWDKYFGWGLVDAYATVKMVKDQFLSVEKLTDTNISSTFDVHQNYPNPFNPSTVIKYQLPVNNFVTLKVYDVMGREAATLVDKQQSAGSYSVQFSVNSYQLSSGVYFYRLQAGNSIETRKMMLMK